MSSITKYFFDLKISPLSEEVAVSASQVLCCGVTCDVVNVSSDDDSLTSIVEFKVSKISTRTLEPTRRLLCLTEKAIIERDIATYCAINLKPLSDVSNDT